MFPQTPTSSRKRMISNNSGAQQQPPCDGSVRLSKRRQITSPFISQNGCVVCMETELQLVQLGSCGHQTCRSCMTSALLHAFKLQQLPLRCPMPHCKAQLQLQPAVQLLEQQVPGSSALAAKVLLAAASDLALIPHHLRCNCPYTDCQVPLEFPDEPLPDVPLDCPSCQRAVCSTCRSKWHSGLSCSQHQSLQASRKMRAAGKQQEQQQQQQQQQPPVSFVVTRSAAAAAAAPPPPPARGYADSMPAWLQDQQQVHRQAQWQQLGVKQQQAQQQQQVEEQAISSGSDAMVWSPAKGSASQ